MHTYVRFLGCGNGHLPSFGSYAFQATMIASSDRATSPTLVRKIDIKREEDRPRR